MNSKYLSHAALVALLAVAAQGAWLGTQAVQSPAQAQARELPTFEVDKAWPKVPPQWKLGDVSNINSDAQGNIYIIHRPRTLKDPDFAMAAPPVLVFDPNGNFLRAWGGEARATNGRSASTASLSTRRASCGSAATAARPTACRGSSPSPTTSS